MKTIKAILIVILLSPVMVMAQHKHHQKMMDKADKQTKWMTINLELSEDQLEEIREANEEYAEERMEIYESGEEWDEMIEELMEEREEYKEEIREALEDEQFNIFIDVEDDWFNEIKEEYKEWDD